MYAIDLEWPVNNKVILASPVELFKNVATTVTLLGNDGNLNWVANDDQVEIQLPDKATVRSTDAYVLKISPAI